jgi:hypothetical protein
VYNWIIIHWFELSALALLCLNLWFVFEVLKVLTAVKDALLFVGRWVDETRAKSSRESDKDL